MAAKATDLAAPGFKRDGFVVVRQLASARECEMLRQATHAALQPLQGPVEFEADVGYPGAPQSRQVHGGETPRRLLSAYSRGDVFQHWFTAQRIRDYLGRFMQTDSICLSQNHHNCVMTKHPGYSSSTAWHQDIRYWSFDRAELVSVWLALGVENKHNGVLGFIPATHTMDLDRGRFNQHLFLRPELAENQALIESAVSMELETGDAVFFHCRTLHAAGRNITAQVKLSIVSTYHSAYNLPIPGTRSAKLPGICL